MKESIQQALTNFEKCAEQIEQLDSILRESFQVDRLKTLQKEIGCVTCPKEISDMLAEIDSLEKKQREGHVKIKCHQGKHMLVIRYFNDNTPSFSIV